MHLPTDRHAFFYHPARRHQVQHGISARPFKRQFNLADYIEVKHAAFEDELLETELVRELPESMKPRRIEVTTSLQANDNKQIEHQNVGSIC